MSILQMSISGAILILAVAIIRQLAIHRLPKKTFMIFWCVVLLRLLIPFSITLPGPAVAVADVEAVAYSTAGPVSEVFYFPNMGITPGILPAADIFETIGDEAAFAGLSDFLRQAATLPSLSAILPEIPESITSLFPTTTVWVTGMLAIALFILATHIRSRRQYKESLPVDNPYISQWLNQHRGLRQIHIRQSDRITAPLTYGILRPVILFPKSTDWQDDVKLQYILTHEMAHIKRLDIITKWLLAIALCVHWFNPLVWVMYIIANRDIELACDEAVVKGLGESTKSTYAMALIGLEERRSVFAPLCTSFSSNLIEERIVAIMKIRKRSIVSMILAAILVAALTIGALTVFASNPAEERLFDPYDIPCETLYIEAIPATLDYLYVEAILAEEDDIPVLDEPGGWEEWLEWFNSLTPEQQAQVSLRPPYETSVYTYAHESNVNQLDWQSPYRIATTLEEVWAALEDGYIPLTNIDVPEIRHRQVYGIIILEQCLYEALDVLHQAYEQSRLFAQSENNIYGVAVYVTRNLVTTRIEMQPPFEEMCEFQRMLMISHEMFSVALNMGLDYVPRGTGLYHTDEDVDMRREEAWRLFYLYDGGWPSDESFREAALLIYGG